MNWKSNASEAHSRIKGVLAIAGLVLMTSACVGGGQLTASSTPTKVLTLPSTNTPTPTATKVIGAVEATATPALTSTPEIETWQGTIHSETTGDYGAAGVCTGEAWDMQFQVQLAGDNSLAGKGSGTIASNPSCSGPGFTDNNYLSHQAKNLQFSVRGARKNKEFDLQLTETSIDGGTEGLINYSLILSLSGNPPVLVVPITGPTSASGETSVTVTVPVSNGSSAIGKHTVSMTCSSCK